MEFPIVGIHAPMHSDANFLVKEIHQGLCDQFIQEWSSLLELTTGKLTKLSPEERNI